MNPIPPADPHTAERTLAAQRDEQLAELLERMTQQQCAGQPPDLEALTAKHPELSAELRELWAAVQVAEGVAAGVSRRAGRRSRRQSGWPAPTVRRPTCRESSATSSCEKSLAAAEWASSTWRGSEPGPCRRREDDLAGRMGLGLDLARFVPRPSRPRGSTIRISCRSTKSASATGSRIS